MARVSKVTKRSRPQKAKPADERDKTEVKTNEMVTPEKAAKKDAPLHTAKASVKPTDPEIDEKVLQEVRTLGLELEYRNLHRRPEVKGISDQELLDALQLCDGLVNKAKEFVLHPVARFISTGAQ
eukprot:gnl/MRDRNA2_/MRDRNA2_94811_c0_seq1.p1 gnl/MRDRNA2_/MRDRNA2_94811_c0~~gnl/MRDRNA2_/MRDRNA2_94811_c0_seq1.p1  ORF type:complete len:125 (-),score=29.57 gnl/MRDRNA2_/MRDRNA2_94811_c0_seq1:106-480(-)